MKRADGHPGASATSTKKPRNDDDEPDFDFDDFDEAEVDIFLNGLVDAAVSGFTVPEHSKQRWLRPAPPPIDSCLLYTSPSPRDGLLSRMPSSA